MHYTGRRMCDTDTFSLLQLSHIYFLLPTSIHCIMEYPNKDCPWYAWKRPDVNLAHVHCFGIYIKGIDKRPTNTSMTQIEEHMKYILQNCEKFHHEQLPGSLLTWSIHGPVELPIELDKLNDEIGANAYYNLGCNYIRLISKGYINENTFPPLLSKSNYHIVTTDNNNIKITKDNNSSSSDYNIKGRVHSLPTHCVFALFSDYGQENVSSNTTTNNNPSTSSTTPILPLDLLRKYFIWKAAEPIATAQNIPREEYLSDVYRTGGSRAGFMGTVPIKDMINALISAKFLLPLSSVPMDKKLAYHVNTLLPNQYSLQDLVNGGPMHIGLGIGVITREAWIHGKEINVCAAVCYHEAIGHGSNMPHPSTRSPLCVMDAGMYTCQPLPGSTICICDEIKMNMKNEDTKLMGMKNNTSDNSTTTVTIPQNKPINPPGNYTFTESIPLPTRQYTTNPTPGPSVSKEISGISTNYTVANMIISRTLSRFSSVLSSELSMNSSTVPLYISWVYTDEETSGDKNTNITVTYIRRSTPVTIATDSMCYICKSNIVETIYRLYMKYERNPVNITSNSSSTNNTSSSSSSLPTSNVLIPAKWIEPLPEECITETIINEQIRELCTHTLQHVQQELYRKIKETNEKSNNSAVLSETNTSDSLSTTLLNDKPIMMGEIASIWEETSSCVTSMIDTLPEMKRVRATDVYHFKEIQLGEISLPNIETGSTTIQIKIMDTVQHVFNRICPTCLSSHNVNNQTNDEAHSWNNIVEELGLLRLSSLSSSDDKYYLPIYDEGRNIAILLPLFHNTALISGSGLGITLVKDSSVTLPTLTRDKVVEIITKTTSSPSSSLSKPSETVEFFGFHTGQWVYGLPT